jgi:hypothetical protein
LFFSEALNIQLYIGDVRQLIRGLRNGEVILVKRLHYPAAQVIVAEAGEQLLKFIILKIMCVIFYIIFSNSQLTWQPGSPRRAFSGRSTSSA